MDRSPTRYRVCQNRRAEALTTPALFGRERKESGMPTAQGENITHNGGRKKIIVDIEESTIVGS